MMPPRIIVDTERISHVLLAYQRDWLEVVPGSFVIGETWLHEGAVPDARVQGVVSPGLWYQCEVAWSTGGVTTPPQSIAGPLSSVVSVRYQPE